MQSLNCTPADLHNHNSPVSKLPPDILGEIFQFSCTDSPNRGRFIYPASPLGLSSVCSYWRSVARATPQIWTSFMIIEDFWASKHKTDILNHFISNSGGLGLDVDISGQLPDKDAKSGEHAMPGGDVFDILFTRHPSKLEFVKLGSDTLEWFPWITAVSEAGHLTRLKSLEVVARGDRQNHSLFSISKVPQLHALVLQGPDLGQVTFEFPWSQITRLSLKLVSYTNALHVITQCTNVEFLDCWNTPYGPWGRNTHRVHVALPRLQHFKCRNEKSGTPWYTDFQYFQYPSLKTLTLDPVPIRECTGSVYWPLSFPSTLTFLSLTLKYDRGESDFLRDGFSSLINLEELKLCCWGGPNPKVIDLLVFCPSSSVGLGTDSNPNSFRFLPQLTNLSVTAYYGDLKSSTYSKVFSRMLEAICSRWKASECQTLRKFAFIRTCGHPGIHYSVISALVSSFGSGLRSMVCEGLEVSVNWDGRDVTGEWLDLSTSD